MLLMACQMPCAFAGMLEHMHDALKCPASELALNVHLVHSCGNRRRADSCLGTNSSCCPGDHHAPLFRSVESHGQLKSTGLVVWVMHVEE